MRYELQGIRLAYEDHGSGIPLVFLHAFPLNRTMWAPQIAALSQHFRTIAIDLRGHGESDAPLWSFSIQRKRACSVKVSTNSRGSLLRSSMTIAVCR